MLSCLRSLSAGVGLGALALIVQCAGCARVPAPRVQGTPPPVLLVVPTYTPTLIPEPDVPTATPAIAEPAPTMTSPAPVPVITSEPPALNVKSNLRAGPGMNYAIVGVLPQGTTVNPTATYDVWLQVDGQWWIHADLVDDVPRGLPQAESIPPTPIPTPAPTADPYKDPYRIATVEKFRQQVSLSCAIEADRLIIHDVPVFKGLQIGIKLGFHNHNPDFNKWHFYHSGNFSAEPGDEWAITVYPRNYWNFIGADQDVDYFTDEYNWLSLWVDDVWHSMVACE